MPSLPARLAALLEGIKHPGTFHASGRVEIFAPTLEVDGVGPVALPLLPIQAEQLIAVADQAPYGKGQETRVDTNVRRTWQIGAERIRIGGKHWPQNLNNIVATVSDKLGVEGPVQAELYKLLLYDAGSFFLSHRDTEKAPGMFATLVIVLPSLFEGGELLVRHRGEEARINLNSNEPSEVTYAAFYADCVHEVLPVTSGCRLTLIYNLVRPGKDRVPEPPDYGKEKARLTDWLKQWGKNPIETDGLAKLIYPLEHAYTQAELSFFSLKGADAARAGIATLAAEPAECDLHLALLSIEESGYAEHVYSGSRRGRYWDDDDDDFEIGEVEDRIQYLTGWRRPDGSQPPFHDLPFEMEELCLSDTFEDMAPDDQHFHEATGNEGASFERTYRRAALVFWPRSRRLAVLNQAGFSVTLPYLNDLIERWSQSGERIGSPLWREAHELSGHILRTWPRHDHYHRTGETASMLDALWRLRDADRIAALLADMSSAGAYEITDNENLVKAAGLLPLTRAVESIERIIANSAHRNLGACANLLARAAAASWSGEPPTALVPAAKTLIEKLAGDEQGTTAVEFWRRRVEPLKPDLVVDLMAGLERIDSNLANQAADCLLTHLGVYDVDSMLIPALLRLTAQAGCAAGRLRNACLEHLRKRISDPLEPPEDWRRSSTIACDCRHCAELERFLADPLKQDWHFKAVQHDRTHVENSIRRAACDLDFETVRKGSPHTLLCVKNQASFDRRVKQREQDLRNLAILERTSQV